MQIRLPSSTTHHASDIYINYAHVKFGGKNASQSLHAIRKSPEWVDWSSSAGERSLCIEFVDIFQLICALLYLCRSGSAGYVSASSGKEVKYLLTWRAPDDVTRLGICVLSVIKALFKIFCFVSFFFFFYRSVLIYFYKFIIYFHHQDRNEICMYMYLSRHFASSVIKRLELRISFEPLSGKGITEAGVWPIFTFFFSLLNIDIILCISYICLPETWA